MRGGGGGAGPAFGPAPFLLGGGGGSKRSAPLFPGPQEEPAHGLHPRFVVAEIWADRGGGGGTHHPACEWTYFFNFPQSGSLRAFTSTHPVLRGMAQRPSVVRSTFRCLVGWTWRHAMASLYRDFTQTKPGWGCGF